MFKKGLCCSCIDVLIIIIVTELRAKTLLVLFAASFVEKIPETMKHAQQTIQGNDLGVAPEAGWPPGELRV